MTSLRQSRLNLVDIVRQQFGTKCDESEARNTHVSAALFSLINFKGRFDFPMARYRARLIGEDVPRAALATGEMR